MRQQQDEPGRFSICSRQAAVVPISFKRIRDRLSLLSPVKEQNRIIKLALKQLQDIGYLDHSITKKGKETFILIHRRSANLKPGTAV
uniref:hypothetical protein n=1 Tax=Klebsiella pneumoniae TaxID=573 RepID=UPI0022B276B9|nr:hypothetical protein [Klebsiella pneumoniae]